MMIEDEELRGIFKATSEEHLQNLDSGLLHLEKNPTDQLAIEALLREAHSLKGDANMLGVKDVGSLAHQIEHVLSQLKQQNLHFSQQLGDRLAHGLAAIRQLVQEAVTGESAKVDTFHVLAILMGGDDATPPTSHPTAPSGHHRVEEEEGDHEIIPVEPPEVPTTAFLPTDQAEIEMPATEHLAADQHLVPDATVNGAPVANGTMPTAASKAEVEPMSAAAADLGMERMSPQDLVTTLPSTSMVGGDSYRIETIRVPTRSLDNLMTQAGELTVTKIRISHRLSEVEAIANIWEEWSRELLRHRFNSQQTQERSSYQRNLQDATELRLEQIGGLISNLKNSLYEDTTRLELIGDELEEGIRTLRLLPFATIFNLFPRMVRDLARQEGKQVELVIEGKETRADKRILEEMKDPLMHLIRNAIDHGIESPEERRRLGKPETATIWLRSYQTSTTIGIEIEDDGRGLDLNRIKHTAVKRGVCREEELATMSSQQIESLIFTPGFSTAPLVTEVSGRGVGLDVVRTNVEKLKGSLTVRSQPGQSCLFRIQLGITLATAHVLIVTLNEIPYAIPVEYVQTACLVNVDEIFTLEGRDTIIRQGRPLSVARLADLLELRGLAGQPLALNASKQIFCIILQSGQEQLGVFVDGLVDEQDVVIKPQSQLLKRVRNVSGATILGTGEVCMVLNPQDLIKSVRRQAVRIPTAPVQQAKTQKHTVLLVEDSIATRTQEKRMLESAGYEVVTAIDGMDGFTKLQSRPFDAIVSDVQMPNLDGLQLAAKVRQNHQYDELPIILVTSLASDEDKRRGAEAGANAYITKSTLNQELLIETLQRLI